MNAHWERARVDAELVGDGVQVKTENVSGLTLLMRAGECPFDNTHKPKVILDGQEVEAAPVLSDRSWTAHFRKADQWGAVTNASEEGLHKRHGLQGPIDDAFMDSFLIVTPTGTPLNKEVGAWEEAEMNHAITHWRKQFRGEPRVKKDDEVTDADLAAQNLILWGDPKSNRILRKIADDLPVRWEAERIRVGEKKYDAANHVALLIYPNPLNPKKYVVLNSGFTYREYDYLNNARQVPKLPDWAVVDVKVPVSSRLPGGIAAAGFFGERWELKVEGK
jgi:hypothetical protein